MDPGKSGRPLPWPPWSPKRGWREGPRDRGSVPSRPGRGPHERSVMRSRRVARADRPRGRDERPRRRVRGRLALGHRAHRGRQSRRGASFRNRRALQLLERAHQGRSHAAHRGLPRRAHRPAHGRRLEEVLRWIRERRSSSDRRDRGRARQRPRGAARRRPGAGARGGTPSRGPDGAPGRRRSARALRADDHRGARGPRRVARAARGRVHRQRPHALLPRGGPGVREGGGLATAPFAAPRPPRPASRLSPRSSASAPSSRGVTCRASPTSCSPPRRPRKTSRSAARPTSGSPCSTPPPDRIPRAPLLWHRSVLEEVPGWMQPSLRHVEQYFIGEGRDAELELIASADRAGPPRHGRGARPRPTPSLRRARLRGAEGSWDATREMIELASAEQDPSLWSLRMLEAHTRASGDDEAFLSVTLRLLDRTSRPAEAATLLGARRGGRGPPRPASDEARALSRGSRTRTQATSPRGVSWPTCASGPATPAARPRRASRWPAAAPCASTSCSPGTTRAASGTTTRRTSKRHRRARGRGGHRPHPRGHLRAALAPLRLPEDAAGARGPHGAPARGHHGPRRAPRDGSEARPHPPRRGRRQRSAHGVPGSARAEPRRPRRALGVRRHVHLAEGLGRRGAGARAARAPLAHAGGAARRLRPPRRPLLEPPGQPGARRGRPEGGLEARARRLRDEREGSSTSTSARTTPRGPSSSSRSSSRRRLRPRRSASGSSRSRRSTSRPRATSGRPSRRSSRHGDAESPLDVYVLRAVAEFYLRHQQTPAFNILLDRAGADARRALAAGRFSTGLFELLATVFDLSRQEGQRRASPTPCSRPSRAGGSDLRGAGGPGLRSEASTTSLAPDVLTPSMRALLARTGDALDIATAIDISRPARRAACRRICSSPASPPRSGQAIGLGPVQIFVSPRLGPTCVPASSTPPVLLVGEALLAQERVAIFLVLRALKPFFDGEAVGPSRARRPPTSSPCWWPRWPGRLQPDVAALQGVNAAAVATMGAKVQAALPRNAARDAGVIALEVAGNLGTMSTTLGAHALSWGQPRGRLSPWATCRARRLDADRLRRRADRRGSGDPKERANSSPAPPRRATC